MHCRLKKQLNDVQKEEDYARSGKRSYTVKKDSDFPLPGRDVTDPTFPCRELFLIPGKGEFGQ